MLNFDHAKIVFSGFLKDYDLSDSKTRLKVVHTERTVLLSEMIATRLNLRNDDVEIAKLIALLHDIGRFDQLKIFNSFTDSGAYDHADLGAKLLSETPLLRRFIAEDSYDSIIITAIRNHNKYMIEEGLNEKESLHARIIRDADKLDNFRVKAVEAVTDIADITEDGLRHGDVSDKVFEALMSHRQVLNSDRKTDIDFWVSIIAFVFDLYFSCSYDYVHKNECIDILVDSIDYQNENTRIKMERIRKTAKEYIKTRVSTICV